MHEDYPPSSQLSQRRSSNSKSSSSSGVESKRLSLHANEPVDEDLFCGCCCEIVIDPLECEGCNTLFCKICVFRRKRHQDHCPINCPTQLNCKICIAHLQNGVSPAPTPSTRSCCTISPSLVTVPAIRPTPTKHSSATTTSSTTPTPRPSSTSYSITSTATNPTSLSSLLTWSSSSARTLLSASSSKFATYRIKQYSSTSNPTTTKTSTSTNYSKYKHLSACWVAKGDSQHHWMVYQPQISQLIEKHYQEKKKNQPAVIDINNIMVTINFYSMTQTAMETDRKIVRIPI